MLRKKVIVLIVALLFSANSYAGFLAYIAKPWVEMMAKNLLVTVDINKDNKMSRDEYMAYVDLEFLRVDINKNQQLSISEVYRLKEPRKKEYFSTVDKNNDHLLSKQEYQEYALQRFARLDKNQDGIADSLEMQETCQEYLNTW